MAEFTIEDSIKKHDKDKDGQISKKEFLGEKSNIFNFKIIRRFVLYSADEEYHFNSPLAFSLFVNDLTSSTVEKRLNIFVYWHGSSLTGQITKMNDDVTFRLVEIFRDHLCPYRALVASARITLARHDLISTSCFNFTKYKEITKQNNKNTKNSHSRTTEQPIQQILFLLFQLHSVM